MGQVYIGGNGSSNQIDLLWKTEIYDQVSNTPINIDFSGYKFVMISYTGDNNGGYNFETQTAWYDISEGTSITGCLTYLLTDLQSTDSYKIWLFYRYLTIDVKGGTITFQNFKNNYVGGGKIDLSTGELVDTNTKFCRPWAIYGVKAS